MGPGFGSSLFASKSYMFSSNIAKNSHFQMNADNIFKSVILHPSTQWVKSIPAYN